MRTSSVRVAILAALATMFLAAPSAATVFICHDAEMELAKPPAESHQDLPWMGDGIPYCAQTQMPGSPLGLTFLAGTTWYDYQHNGSIGKMIALSPNSGIHVCWMNGLEANAINRHIYYNYFKDGVFGWPGVGYQVDQGNRGGYTCLDQFSGGEVVVAFHQGSDPWYAAAAYDFLEGFGAFQITNIDAPVDYEPVSWPHVAVDSQDYIHMVAHENRTEVWQRLTYSRSQDGGANFSTWVEVDTIVTLSGITAASPVSNKVGIAYTESYFDVLNLGPYDGLLVSQLNNGISLVESEDGVTWNFNDERDITDLVQPDESRYPDSTWANGDTLRPYCDVSLLYDYDDNAHAAFSTRGLWFDARLAAIPDSFAIIGLTVEASIIWHWSEEHDSMTVIADGWYDVGDPDAGANEHRGAGAWRSTVDRPSLGINPSNGYLYCTYQRCVEGDTSGGPIPSHGFANGEVFCSVSTDGGLNWSMPVNLTNTPSPNAWAGQCMDEDYSSLASVVNDTLHIIYVEDKDAGGVVQTSPQEGTWTQNPVKYLKVPANLVPAGPPYVPNFNFHVGPSTGVEEPSRVSGTVPQSFALHQNYPNPFNPQTTIRFDLAQDGPVTIRIYNVSGQLVRELANGRQAGGTYEVVWNGHNSEGQAVPSGIYFYQMRAGQFSDVKKMALIK